MDRVTVLPDFEIIHFESAVVAAVISTVLGGLDGSTGGGSGRLVRRRSFHGVDNKDFDRAARGFQLQP